MKRGGKKIELPPQFIAMLGVRSDGQVAKASGIHALTVRQLRLDLGIVRKRGRPLGSKSSKPLPAAIIARLGTAPDWVVAKEIKKSVATVRHYRRKLNIKPLPHVQPCKLTPECEALLGKVADEAIAKRCGVSRKRVHQWRVARGIPSKHGPRGPNKKPA